MSGAIVIDKAWRGWKFSLCVRWALRRGCCRSRRTRMIFLTPSSGIFGYLKR